MVPEQVMEFVVLELMYLEELGYPVSLSRKRRSVKGFKPQIQHWFERIMQIEKSKIPLDMNVRYCQWRVLTGDMNLFTINGCRYNNAIVILGEETKYWAYYDKTQIQKFLEGSSRVQESYCNCCLDDQYINIMKRIEDCIVEAAGSE